ncbi:hemerythrin domain-containing protein [Rivibacter subsaxonicus]|uniref:Hemerythrin HHE cation binding domain-containing protein n=1 Tax=Rivibacter subsaxonicus TaxID=457575 RepID=A0A4Q7W0B8_9BURK|nr:hemerythrin domain-containing protein [Rivibacter subsaxonicus]RZU02443.1 hemerythrin HHE cation binding domain-containing protein [Rivibacter subsaxonicus]
MSRLPFPVSAATLHASPDASFDEPFGMLAACHGRVQRSCALLARLVEHLLQLQQQPVDAMAADAARDVLRYFDLAAPAHHLDEERHVFPRVEAGGDAELAALVGRLHTEHRLLDAQWRGLHALLQPVASGGFDATTLPALQIAARDFIALNESHLALEDRLVLPAADALASAADRAAMGAEMAARRGLPRP